MTKPRLQLNDNPDISVHLLQVMSSLFIIAATGLITAPVQAETYRQAIVLPLQAEGVGNDVAEGLRAALTEAIDESDTWASLDATRRLDKLAHACDREDWNCLAKVADKRGADVAIVGKVAASERGIIATLHAVEVSTSQVTNSCDEILGGDAAGLAKTATRAITQLLSPQNFNGSLQLRCNISDAEVFVDDSLRGKTPLTAPVDGLREGKHKLLLKKLGYKDATKDFAIVFQQKTHLQINMMRRTDISSTEVQKIQAEAEAAEHPWRPNMQPWSWGMAGLGGAMILAGIGTGIAVWSISAAVEQRASYQVFIFPDDSDRVISGRNLALTTNLLWGFGSLMGLSGLGLGIWDELVPAPVRAVKNPAAISADDEDDAWDAEVTHYRAAPEQEQEGTADSKSAGTAFSADDLPNDDMPDGDLPEGDL